MESDIGAVSLLQGPLYNYYRQLLSNKQNQKKYFCFSNTIIIFLRKRNLITPGALIRDGIIS